MGIEHEQSRASSLPTSSSFILAPTEIDNDIDTKSDESYQKHLVNSGISNKELLGSVTVQNCPGVRTSARVIQKMKQDSYRSASPPLHDKKDGTKEERTVQKTPNQSKTAILKNTWTNSEKKIFFDALNECGKDFDAVYNFINSKIKKISIDQSAKTKEQIRHSYYQTFHKLSKYIKFSDEVKKPAQELYALINYGEMRRKLAFVSEKNLMKIRELVYKGHVTVRSKGRSIKIKTPSCKALRKLNQLEGWLEDIKLPLKVEVCLRPATMGAWGRVQNIAQNPIVRTVVPLQKKLINIIKTFQYRWRSQEIKFNETALKLFGNVAVTNETLKCDKNEYDYQNFVSDEPLICFIPQKDVTIHRPLVSITQYLSSFNICLNSYEERFGIKIRGESLWQEKSHKRQRTDSGCEKKSSPDNKKSKLEPASTIYISDNETNKDYKYETEEDISGEDITDLIFEDINKLVEKRLLNDSIDFSNTSSNDGGVKAFFNLQQKEHENLINNSSTKPCLQDKTKKSGKKKDKESKKDVNNLKSLISEDILKKIRKGWTILNAADITIGDLYIVFGNDSKLMFEYNWINDTKSEFDINHLNVNVPTHCSLSVKNEKNDIYKIHNSLSNKLKHLLLIANLNERIKKKQCSCGNICAAKTKQIENDMSSKSYVSNVTYTGTHSEINVFRQPSVPFRRTLAVQSFKQIPTGHRIKQSRFLRTGKIGSRQIVVQRLLPIQPGVDQSYDVVTPQLEIRTLQEDSNNDNFDEIAPNKQDHINESKNQLLIKKADTTVNNTISIDKSTDLSCVDNVDYSFLNQSNNAINENYADLNNVNNTIENRIVDLSESISADTVSNSDLSPLLDLSLPSPLPINSLDENDSLGSIPVMSPMQLLRETNGDSSKWLDDNINDFSLTSFFGHLDEINNRDSSIDNANMSIISESSVDYVTKFAEIASIQNGERDLL